MFLAKTAVEEFWDKNKKILFLGEWCKLYSRKNVWSKLEHETFEYIWEDRRKYEEAYAYCARVFEDVMEKLSQELNQIHGVKKSMKYYRITLGMWVNHYIDQLYDKYRTLKQVFSEHPDLQTLLLDASDFYTPVDFLDFMEKMCDDDRYCLQQYSVILQQLGYAFSAAKLTSPIPQRKTYSVYSNKRSHKVRSLLARLQGCINSLCYSENRSVTLTEPYFLYDRFLPYKMFLKSRFQCIADDMTYNVQFDFRINETLRRNTKLHFDGQDEFKALVGNVIFQDIPVLFLEGREEFTKQVLSKKVKKSKIFYTAGATYFMDFFKFYVAEHAEETILIEAQHGGVLGTHCMAQEEVDLKGVDYYFTFGWSETEKQIPMFFVNGGHERVCKEDVNRKKMVLLARSAYPRYAIRFISSYTATENINYVNSTIKFLKTLSPDVRLFLRDMPDADYQWLAIERIKDAGAACVFDDPAVRFIDRLRETYIFVSDHAGSTYLESLVIGCPTIVFYDPNVTKFRPSALPYCDTLKDAGIFHETPESAANFLNSVYDDVDRWWESKEVRAARLTFVNRYARYDPRWMNKLFEKFNEILEKEKTACAAT